MAHLLPRVGIRGNFYRAFSSAAYEDVVFGLIRKETNFSEDSTALHIPRTSSLARGNEIMKARVKKLRHFCVVCCAIGRRTDSNAELHNDFNLG